MDLAIGIDVGFSATARSTGVVVMDRATRAVAPGTEPRVDRAADALGYLLDALDRLKPERVHISVDGSFACAAGGASRRAVESFFSCGPFASVPNAKRMRLRLMPSGTAARSPFLASTRRVVEALVRRGHSEMRLVGDRVEGRVVEIFPTMFMATLLPPHAYTGSRGAHTDDLWLKLIGDRDLEGARGPHPLIAPYGRVVAEVERARKRDLHDLRAAAISAIAADWFAAGPPGSGGVNACSYVGNRAEAGFVLPPRAWWSPEFAAMVELHRRERGAGLPLKWL